MRCGFGLPPEVADKAKGHCAKTVTDFLMHVICIKVEGEIKETYHADCCATIKYYAT